MSRSPIVDLVGKQIHHTWDQNGMSFVSVFCDETTFVWNDLSDPENMVTGTETYGKMQLSDEIVMYNWKESPEERNFGITWTFNFDTGIVYGIIVNVFPNSNLELTAPFEIVNGFDVPEGYITCD